MDTYRVSFQGVCVVSKAVSTNQHRRYILICDVLQEKVTYVGKHNFAVEWKIAGNFKKVKFQVFMDTCSTYIWEPCTLSKNSIWFNTVCVNMRRSVCLLS